MKPTKIALDPQRCEIPGDAKSTQAMADIRHSMIIHLSGLLQKSDLVRTLAILGQPELMLKAANGNEIQAKFMIYMIDEFEGLIATGYGYTAAMYCLLQGKWYQRICEFELMEAGNGAA